MKKEVEIFIVGKFCNAYGDDGIILHNLLGYKFVRYKNSVGFPESGLNKVKSILEDKKISYKIYLKNDLLEEYAGFKENYKKELKVSLNNLDIERRMERIRTKIENCNEEELETILEAIENG